MNDLQGRVGKLESVTRHRRTKIVWRNEYEAADQATARWRAAHAGEGSGADIFVIGGQGPTPAAEQRRYVRERDL